jgi:hypothetical protein
MGLFVVNSKIFLKFFGGQQCVGHTFAYVAHFVFFRDVWNRTQTYLKITLRYRYRYKVPNNKVPNHKLPNVTKFLMLQCS